MSFLYSAVIETLKDFQVVFNDYFELFDRLIIYKYTFIRRTFIIYDSFIIIQYVTNIYEEKKEKNIYRISDSNRCEIPIIWREIQILTREQRQSVTVQPNMLKFTIVSFRDLGISF